MIDRQIEKYVKSFNNKLDIVGIDDKKIFNILLYKRLTIAENIIDEIDNRWYRFYKFINIPFWVLNRSGSGLILYLTKKLKELTISWKYCEV